VVCALRGFPGKAADTAQLQHASPLTRKTGSRQCHSWLDLCCGSGKALIEAAQIVHDRGMDGKIEIVGVDSDTFSPPSSRDHLFSRDTFSPPPSVVEACYPINPIG
jgi:hypothetical protein